MNTTDIQLSLDNDRFWLTYNIAKSPADGHCFVHSIAKSLGSQLPEHVCFKKEALLEKLKIETHENAHQYVDYIDGVGIQSLYSGVNKYVTHKQYDTSYGDIVPFIMSNAICINFMIIIQLADSYRVQLVECVANDRPILILFKKGEHYDAIAFKPTVNLSESNMALPCKPTVVHSVPHCGVKQLFDNDRNDRNDRRHNTFRVAGLNVCGLIFKK